jgi:nitroreductase
MEVLEAIRKRKSVRVYKDTPIPENKLKYVLEAARLAPSAANSQDWKFVVVRDLKRKTQLAEAASEQYQIALAPVVIAGVATNTNKIMMCGIPAHFINLAIAIDHMTLVAVDQGLGSCWIGAFLQEETKRILKIPDDHLVIGLLTLGFPAIKARRSKIRKSLDEIVCYETFME